MEILYFTCVLLLLYQAQWNAAYETYEEGTVEFCMYEYPYTYSKCLYICNGELEPACVSDSMCVCDVNMMTTSKSNRYDLLDPRTNCVKTPYCDVSCREKNLHEKYFNSGLLCERDSKSSCVCLY